jgi:hypothetical protein
MAAFRKLGTIYAIYEGLSTDTKPTLNAYEIGTATETDTGDEYTWNGATWVLKGKANVDGKKRVSAMPYTYDIAEGNISTHTPWAKTGYNPAVTSTEADMWFGASVYVFPSGGTMQVQSTVTTDGVAGPGVRTAYIKYLNTSWVEATETITLNGSTIVSTAAADIYRVNNFRAATAGTTAKAAGNITLKNSTGAITYNTIAAGYTRARNNCYNVPLGKTLFVTSIGFSCAQNSTGMRFTTRATYDNVSGLLLSTGLMMPYHEVIVTNGSFTKELEIPTKLPEKTDIKVSIMGTGTSGGIAFSNLRGWLETP